MARIKLTIPVADFQATVNAVEAEHKPASQGKLWEMVCETAWAKALEPRPLTPQVAMIRAKELGITVTTPKGKRGGDGTFGGKRGGGTGPRVRKGMTNIDAFIARVPKRALNDKMYALLGRAEKGSLKAIVKLQCLSCANFAPSEVKNCGVESCAIYGIRPYQGG